MYSMPNVDTLLPDTTLGEIQFVLGEIPEMYSIYPVTEGDYLFPAKQLLDYREFATIEVASSIKMPTRTENGEMKPYVEWNESTTMIGTSLNVSDGFHFEYQDIFDEGEYYYMFQMYDLQGNCTSSELFPLPTNDVKGDASMISQKSLMETERGDYAKLIQGVTVKSAEAFATETQIELGNNLEDFTFRLDGYTYELPMPLSHLSETGWIFDSWCDFSDINLTPGDYTNAYMHKDGKTIQIEVFNPYGQNKKFKDCIVSRMSFEFPTETELILAKDIATDVINLDNVISFFGNPNSVLTSEDAKSVTLEYDFGYSDLLTANYCNYVMCFSVETKQLESLVIANYTEAEEASDKEDIQYLKAYTAPEALGEDLFSWNVELMGDVYTLPAPVSVFTENGWEIILAQNVKAGKSLEKGIIMQKDGVVVEFSVYNFSAYQTSAADATIYKMTEQKSGLGAGDDLQLTLPGNISIGMTEEAFLQILEKDAKVKEAFSVYEYESYDGTKSVTYSYSDFMIAGMDFLFNEGKLQSISIYNENCKYKNESGKSMTISK
jgi:hypothetical protein